MRTKTAPATCTICDCKGDVWLHNTNAINRMRQAAKDATTDTCPKCSGPANPLLVEKWGHCMQCQKASQSAKYGF
jgi:predicted molibdopterin-dependent oxidoreductase YjgC